MPSSVGAATRPLESVVHILPLTSSPDSRDPIHFPAAGGFPTTAQTSVAVVSRLPSLRRLCHRPARLILATIQWPRGSSLSAISALRCLRCRCASSLSSPSSSSALRLWTVPCPWRGLWLPCPSLLPVPSVRSRGTQAPSSCSLSEAPAAPTSRPLSASRCGRPPTPASRGPSRRTPPRLTQYCFPQSTWEAPRPLSMATSSCSPVPSPVLGETLGMCGSAPTAGRTSPSSSPTLHSPAPPSTTADSSATRSCPTRTASWSMAATRATERTVSSCQRTARGWCGMCNAPVHSVTRCIRSPTGCMGKRWWVCSTAGPG